MKHFYLKFTKKTFIHLFLGMSLLLVSQEMMAQKTSTQSGSWTDTATWGGNPVPTNAELVTIAAGHTVDFAPTATATIGSLSIAGTLNITGTFSRSIGNITVVSGGTFSTTGTGSTSILADNNIWTNNGTFTATNIGTGTNNSSRTINNNGTMNLNSGIGSTSRGVINNNSGATLAFTGTIAGTINNFGTMNAAGLSGSAATAVLNNKSTGVLNFTGSTMSAANLVLDASEAGNTVNYSLAGSQTVKIPSTTYSKLILSNSGTKTIPTAASGTLCSGTLTISGAGGGSGVRASVTNAGVKVNMLILNTTGQVSTGTIGITASVPATVNNTYFVTGTGTLDVQKTYAFTSIAAGGNWNNASTWVDGAVPANSSADYVVIVSGLPVSLTLGSNFTVGALDVNSGGTLNVTGAFTFTIASRSPFSNIAGSLNLDGTTGSKSFGNITVASGGIIDSLGGATSIASTATAAWVNNGSISVTTLGLTTGEAIENNGTFSCTGVGSTSGGVFNNNSAGTFTLNGTMSGNINNFGTMNSSGLSGNSAVANITNKAAGVLNFTGGSMTSTTLVLDASEAGNTVNYSGTSQTVKLPTTSYSNLILSNSGNKTIGSQSFTNPVKTETFAASGTLCSGTLTISGTAKATITNTNVAVNRLFLGTTEQFAGTIGGTTSGATTINTSYFNAGAGTLNVATGVTETTWNGTSWSPAAPTSVIDAIINGNYSTSSGAITAKNLTVNNGVTLTVNSSASVTAAAALVNNGGVTGGIVVQNNANLIQTAGTDTNTGSGNVTVNRDSNSLKRLDYTLWSTPVKTGNRTFASFSPLTTPSRNYIYNPGNNLYNSVGNTGTFSAGTGYLIRMPDALPSDPLNTETDYYKRISNLTFTGVFTGTALNNGLVTITTEAGKYYAVGNPYPSTISATDFLTENNTDDILYFWRKTNGGLGTAYAVYNPAMGSTGNGGFDAPDGTIQVGQGFIVKAEGTELVFNNTMRDPSSSEQFFKTKAQAEKSRVWLNLNDAEGMINQTLVGYLDSATTGVDKGIDGKSFGDGAIELASSIDGASYSIQGRPAFDATDVVALNFKTSVAGTYTIAIDHVDGLFSKGQDIYLVDKTTGTTTNLNEGAYTFTAAVGVDNTRFTLTYQKTLKVGAPVFNENSVLVSRNNGTLNVKSTEVALNNVKVYDMQGRLVAERKNVKSNTATISNLRTNQVLIVKVTSENNAVVTKKVLN